MLNKSLEIKINFVSNNSRVQTSIPCSSNDLFAAIENQLYEKYPEFQKQQIIHFYAQENLF